MKSFFALIFFGLLGGVIGSYFFNYFSNSGSADISQAIATTPTPSVYDSASYGLWEKLVSEFSPSVVNIQVFESDRLVKQGSGMIISSDGLIVTVADVAVADAIYQIAYDDKITRGKIAAIDYKLNLALFKTENSYSSVVDMGVDNYQSGQEVVLVGKMVDLLESAVFSQRGIISYVGSKNILIDASANNGLVGSGVVNSEGKLAGLAYLRNGKINMVRGVDIDTFFKTYSAKKSSD